VHVADHTDYFEHCMHSTDAPDSASGMPAMPP